MWNKTELHSFCNNMRFDVLRPVRMIKAASLDTMQCVVWWRFKKVSEKYTVYF
jgi:hypothetical protein